MLVSMCPEISCLLRLFPMAAWRKAGHSGSATDWDSASAVGAQRLEQIINCCDKPTEYEEKCSLRVASKVQVTEPESHGVGVSVFVEMGMRRPGAFPMFFCCVRFFPMSDPVPGRRQVCSMCDQGVWLVALG